MKKENSCILEEASFQIHKCEDQKTLNDVNVLTFSCTFRKEQ